MSIKELIDSLLLRRKLFFFLAALSVVLCSAGLKANENYTAEIIIKYIGASAEEGLAENGEKINPYEINSSQVVKNAVTELGLNKSNIERICRSITITPIISIAEQEKHASWLDKFSDYEKNEEGKKHTVYYSVKYTTPEGKDYAKRMLSAIISQYRLYYVKKYTYGNDVTQLPGEAALQYDYYDTVDMLRKKINANIEYISDIAASDTDYRSPKTGYSLMDLVNEYTSLRDRNLSIAEQTTLENGITKDAGYLKNSLQNKIIDAQYEIELNSKKAETQKTLMTVYSEKNRQYLWDKDSNKNSGDSESSQVRENVERDQYYTHNKTVYDNLVLDYAKYRTNALNNDIDRQIYESDIKSFSESTNNEDQQMQLLNILKTTCENFNELYELTSNTIDDYNIYKSAKSIESISGVVSRKTASTIFYYGVSIIIAMAFGVFLSVLFAYLKKGKEFNNDKSL